VKLFFTPSGRIQFLAALSYIYHDNPSAAVSFRRKAEKVLRRLRKFPHSGRVLPEFSELPYREILVAPYRFFYRVKGQTVWVVAVWHSAQLPTGPHGAEIP